MINFLEILHESNSADGCPLQCSVYINSFLNLRVIGSIQELQLYCNNIAGVRQVVTELAELIKGRNAEILCTSMCIFGSGMEAPAMFVNEGVDEVQKGDHFLANFDIIQQQSYGNTVLYRKSKIVK